MIKYVIFFFKLKIKMYLTKTLKEKKYNFYFKYVNMYSISLDNIFISW